MQQPNGYEAAPPYRGYSPIGAEAARRKTEERKAQIAAAAEDRRKMAAPLREVLRTTDIDRSKLGEAMKRVAIDQLAGAVERGDASVIQRQMALLIDMMGMRMPRPALQKLIEPEEDHGAFREAGKAGAGVVVAKGDKAGASKAGAVGP